MKHIAIALTVVLVLAVATASAVGPAGPAGKNAGDKAGKGDPAQAGPAAKKAGPGDKTGPTKPANAEPLTEDQQKAAEISAKLVAGQVDEALAEAQAFAAKTLDDKAKTEALRIAADCVRKKADWKGAAQAYTKLKERYEKGSDDYVRYEAIAQILAASPTGVYMGAGPGAKGDLTSTLADDAVLKTSIGRLVTQRGGKLKSRIYAFRQAKTPQQVAVAFKPVVEDAKPLLQLGTDSAVDVVKEVAEAAGKRLQEIARANEAGLRAKLKAWQWKFEKPWLFNNLDKEEMPALNASCKAMAQAEKDFQESLMLLSGAWPGAELLRRESADRSAVYEGLSAEFVIPKWIRIG
ncbi:MAG: hypothetical protein NTU94_14710 [Planctomycetota bacterium]|nr:hypothetical protein [Planctomycetota bacterium]